MNGGFFGYDGPFFNVLNRITDIIILNVIWLICCIPIVTIGASTTALLYVTMKILNGEDAYIVKNFFKSFKENFVQSTIMWIIMLAIGAVLVCDYLFLPQMNIPDSMYNVIFSASCFSALLYAMILVYLFPLQARLENKIKHTFKNALLLSFRHLPSTLLLVVVVFVPLGFAWMNFASLFLIWFLFAGAGIALLCSMIYNRIFNIYIKPEGEEEISAEENESDSNVVEENAIEEVEE